MSQGVYFNCSAGEPRKCDDFPEAAPRESVAPAPVVVSIPGYCADHVVSIAFGGNAGSERCAVGIVKSERPDLIKAVIEYVVRDIFSALFCGQGAVRFKERIIKAGPVSWARGFYAFKERCSTGMNLAPEVDDLKNGSSIVYIVQGGAPNSRRSTSLWRSSLKWG